MKGEGSQLNPEYVLPRRNFRQLGELKRCHPRKFVANYYDVQMKPSVIKVYLYNAQFPEQIPSDSTQVFVKCLLQLRSQLRKSIGFITFSGKVIYGFKQNKISETYQCKIDEDVISVQLKLVKQLSVIELLQDPRTRPSIFQFLNSSLKTCMRQNKICEMGKQGSFYPKDQLTDRMSAERSYEYRNLQKVGLSILRGYKFTLTMLNHNLRLQLDVCSRVLQGRNLLQDMQEYGGTNQDLINYFVGQTIITRYGNYKTYKIEDLDFSINPNSKFSYGDNKITFKDYFRKCYNIEIYQTKQPLIKVLAQVKKFITKKQQLNQAPQYIYLIPELVSLTGMTDIQRANHESMRALSPFTKLNPADRFDQSQKIVSLLNKNNQVLTIGSEQYMNGFTLDVPTIEFQQPANLRGGNINYKGALFQSHKFNKWMYVYSACSQQDYNQACFIQSNLYNASKTYGISYNQPCYVQVKAANKISAADFIYALEFKLQELEKIQLIFVILKPRQTAFYGEIKNYLVNQAKIPSQVVKAQSLSKSKNVLSIAGKVAIQMNCKAGSAPWIVNNMIPYFRQKSFAYASLSTSKGKGGFTISFVGTLNCQCNKVYSNYALRVNKKQAIDKAHLSGWFLNWIKNFFMENKSLPQLLIIYRQSVGGSLMKPVVQAEAIQVAGTKTKVPNYSPEIIYLFINKKINSRFYEQQKNQLYNPEPGSVIVHDLCIDNQFDFHLAAQKVTQGTCTPTQYIVGYDESKIPQQDLIQFTYDQCYNYYNWQGTIKVPATLQCANKLSKLAGESIKKQFEGKGVIDKTFYFL